MLLSLYNFTLPDGARLCHLCFMSLLRIIIIIFFFYRQGGSVRGDPRETAFVKHEDSARVICNIFL
jgi:hypothetical protein